MSTLHEFASGIQMGESPRWHEGRFWMCDWLAGEVLAFDSAGDREVVARVEGLPFSIDWLADGRLVVSTSDGVRVGPDLERYGAAGRPWNEIVVDDHGHVFVDMPGSLPHEAARPGLVAVVAPDGTTTDVADDVWFPNGMAVTADGSTLLVAESHATRITAFTIAADGTLHDRRVWAELPADEAPDGICLDVSGALWYATVPGQRCRRIAEGGDVLETIEVGRPCFACMLGDDDGRTLYIVTNSWDGSGAGDGRVLTTRVEQPHAGRP